MIKNTYPGKFIVVEGLDGSGKSSQVELLVNFLKNLPAQSGKSKEVILTREPTKDSNAGRKIEQVLDGKVVMEPLELQKLFSKDRMEHLEHKVIPALKEGKFVVSSRYAFSSFSYGAGEGLDLNELIEMNNNFLLPDITIIIDVLPEHCVERIEERGEPKKYFEKLEKLEKVNEFYKKMPGIFENIHVVEGEKPIDEVFDDIKKLVNNIL